VGYGKPRPENRSVILAKSLGLLLRVSAQSHLPPRIDQEIENHLQTPQRRYLRSRLNYEINFAWSVEYLSLLYLNCDYTGLSKCVRASHGLIIKRRIQTRLYQ
jgi:hypothetical protein